MMILEVLSTVLLGLLVFMVVVVVHEYGHFRVARAVGIRVDRFSIGMGPVVFSRRVNGVQYAISAIPLGGYVKMAGDDPRNREALVPGDFFAAAWWRRVLVALAGPGANFVLAIALSILLAWVGVSFPDFPNLVESVPEESPAAELGFRPGDRIVAVQDVPTASRRPILEALDHLASDGSSEPVTLEVERSGERVPLLLERDEAAEIVAGLVFRADAVVGEVEMGAPAYKQGLKRGDLIVEIDGQPITSWMAMTEIIRSSPEKELAFTVEREGRRLSIPITPAAQESDSERIGRIGIGLETPLRFTVRSGFLEGIRLGTEATVTSIPLFVEGIGRLFSSPSNLTQVMGPVGIIQASGEAAKSGPDRLLNFGIMLSIALMVFNLLPIPILDGGMVLLSVLEGARRRPVGEKGLAIYQGIGFAVIGALLIIVFINDPRRIIERLTALGRATDVSP